MEQINKLVEKQEKLAEELNKKYMNLKKDSKSRKTEPYLLAKLQDVEDVWQDFVAQHQEIVKSGRSSEHPYAKTNYYNQVEVIYLKAKVYLKECQETLKDETKETQMEQFLDQERRIDLLRADIESSKTATEGYEQYLEDIKRQFMTIVDKDIELGRMKQENRELQYYKDDKFLNIKTEYRAATITLDRQIKQQRCSPTRTTFNSMALPRIKIPIFNGKYEEWPTFQDIFTTMIDTNANISMVEKMQYLKTYVKGEAEKAIQHYEITESNYTSAWKELKERYDNKRRIVNKLINKILHIPQMQRELSEYLKNIYNTVKECLEALKMQKIDTTSWDPMMVCIVTNKWDARTNDLYEATVDNIFEVQPLESVLKFLLKRFQTMEASEAKPSDRRGTQSGYRGFEERGYRGIDERGPQTNCRDAEDKRVAMTKCKYCNRSHSIYSCVDFKGLDNIQRHEFIKKQKLCFSCLNHDSSKKCLSRLQCRTCNKNHKI